MSSFAKVIVPQDVLVASTGVITNAFSLRVENTISFREFGAIPGTDTHLVFDEINTFIRLAIELKQLLHIGFSVRQMFPRVIF